MFIIWRRVSGMTLDKVFRGILEKKTDEREENANAIHSHTLYI